MDKLKIISFENCKELGVEVNNNYLVNVEASRFNNGEGKLYISYNILIIF